MANTMSAQTGKVQIELPSKLLLQFITSGVLHGDDCRCLNSNAKKTLWQALLKSSTNTDGSQGDNICV